MTDTGRPESLAQQATASHSAGSPSQQTSAGKIQDASLIPGGWMTLQFCFLLTFSMQPYFPDNEKSDA